MKFHDISYLKNYRNLKRAVKLKRYDFITKMVYLQNYNNLHNNSSKEEG